MFYWWNHNFPPTSQIYLPDHKYQHLISGNCGVSFCYSTITIPLINDLITVLKKKAISILRNTIESHSPHCKCARKQNEQTFIRASSFPFSLLTIYLRKLFTNLKFIYFDLFKSENVQNQEQPLHIRRLKGKKIDFNLG